MIQSLDALYLHHVATVARPQASTSGISWIWARNGIFKRASTEALDITIQVGAQSCAVPGLACLLPSVRWTAWPERIPAGWLHALLADARQAAIDARPIEKQYFIVYRGDAPRLIAPRNQVGTAASVHYAMPADKHILVDIHSHHVLAGGAFFSGTDDRDDTGLSVSVVIGHIMRRPEIICRLNVYGDHQLVPALAIFDGLGPFVDAMRSTDADAHD